MAVAEPITINRKIPWQIFLAAGLMLGLRLSVINHLLHPFSAAEFFELWRERFGDGAFLSNRARADDHQHQFLICRKCGTTAELSDHAVSHALEAAAQRAGFKPDRMTVEVEGLCSRCA